MLLPLSSKPLSQINSTFLSEGVLFEEFLRENCLSTSILKQNNILIKAHPTIRLIIKIKAEEAGPVYR